MATDNLNWIVTFLLRLSSLILIHISSLPLLLEKHSLRYVEVITHDYLTVFIKTVHECVPSSLCLWGVFIFVIPYKLCYHSRRRERTACENHQVKAAFEAITAIIKSCDKGECIHTFQQSFHSKPKWVQSFNTCWYPGVVLELSDGHRDKHVI